MAERFGNDLVLLERIAAGGMAEVYRAKQLGLSGFQKTIAVKRILPNYAMNEEFKEMFRDEANLSALLAHQNIVQIFGNGEFNDYLYLTMEFVDGKNARQLLARADKKKVRIPIEYSIFVVAEAAKGLEYAHNFVDEKTGQPLEIVHRDMSPQNMMVSYDGAVKIVDFGIAKAAARSGQTKAGVLKGKFGYMSPEQATGMNLDRRTDVFAIGIILFELLTQRRLFTSDDDLKTLQLVKDCRVPRPSKYNPDVTPTLDNIVLKALKREKAERYNNAGELYVDLYRYLNQKYPKFLSTELAKFIRELFDEDIIEEKKKRDKANSEMGNMESTSEPGRSTPIVSANVASPSSPRNLSTMVSKNKSAESHEKTNVTESQSASPRDVKTLDSRTLDSKSRDLPDPIVTLGNMAAKDTPKDDNLFASSQSDNSMSKADSLSSNGAPSNASRSSPLLKFGNENVQMLKEAVSISTPQKAANDARAAYDADLLRSHLNRPVKMTPKQSKSILSPKGIGAALVLIGIGVFSYLKQEVVLPVCTAPMVESTIGSGKCLLDNNRSPVSECLPGFVRIPEDSKDEKDCKSMKELCPKVGEEYDLGAKVCVAIKAPPDEICPLGLVMDPVTKRCAPKVENCKAPKKWDPQSKECVAPVVSNMPELMWSSEEFSPSGLLNLNSTPRSQKITINGALLVNKERKPLQTPIVGLRLKPGNYLIRVENDFYGWSREQRITIENSRTIELDLAR